MLTKKSKGTFFGVATDSKGQVQCRFWEMRVHNGDQEVLAVHWFPIGLQPAIGDTVCLSDPSDLKETDHFWGSVKIVERCFVPNGAIDYTVVADM